MALTLRSLASAAKRRAQRAQQHVQQAEEDLQVANSELDRAIPSGDVTQIQHARQRTGQAERAVADAAEELEVVGELLAEDGPVEHRAGSDASGAGVRGLVKSLRSTRKP
jgi:hypothetical protein